MTINRNTALKTIATVFQSSEEIDTKLNKLINNFHGNVPTKEVQEIDYELIGRTDWAVTGEDEHYFINQIRELFKEIFNLKRLGERMIKKITAGRVMTETYVKAIVSWKYHLEILKDKLFHYNFSIVDYQR